MDNGLIAFTEGGDWLTASLSSPLAVQPGDTLEVDRDGKVWLKRNGHYIDSRTISSSQPLELESFQFPATIERVIFFVRHSMASQVTLVRAYYDESSPPQLILEWGDGTGDSYPTFAAMEADASAWAANTENAKMIARLALVHRSNEGSDVTACNGSVVVVDGQSAALVTTSGVPTP